MIDGLTAEAVEAIEAAAQEHAPSLTDWLVASMAVLLAFPGDT